MADEERHIIRVPNWVWRWAQDRTGKSRPSSFLVDLLSEAVHLQRVGLVSPAEAADEDSDDDAEPEEGHSDVGAVIVAEYSTVCNDCGLLIEEGERCLIRRNAHGRKEMFHLDHLRREA